MNQLPEWAYPRAIDPDGQLTEEEFEVALQRQSLEKYLDAMFDDREGVRTVGRFVAKLQSLALNDATRAITDTDLFRSLRNKAPM